MVTGGHPEVRERTLEDESIDWSDVEPTRGRRRRPERQCGWSRSRASWSRSAPLSSSCHARAPRRCAASTRLAAAARRARSARAVGARSASSVDRLGRAVDRAAGREADDRRVGGSTRVRARRARSGGRDRRRHRPRRVPQRAGVHLRRCASRRRARRASRRRAPRLGLSPACPIGAPSSCSARRGARSSSRCRRSRTAGASSERSAPSTTSTERTGSRPCAATSSPTSATS